MPELSSFENGLDDLMNADWLINICDCFLFSLLLLLNLSAIVTTTMQIFVRADRTYTLDVEVLSPSFL